LLSLPELRLFDPELLEELELPLFPFPSSEGENDFMTSAMLLY
jgi:hypothetical protein